MPSMTHSTDSASDHQSFDLVVVGAGMAGVMAAMAAKTPDNSVLLIEPSNVLGGQGTAGGVAGFCGDTERVNDLFAELVERLAEHDLIGPVILPEAPFSDRRDYDLEWCAFFLQEMVVARGVEVLLHSRVIGTESDGGVIRSLTVATASGLMKVSAKFVIDATGACIVPLQAGFPVIHEGANKQLPMSLYFTMWDTGKPVKPILPAGCPKWETENDIPMTSLHFFPTGKIEVKMKVVGFDAADGRSRSEAEMFARRYMHGLIYFLQTKGYRNVPPMNTHVLASVSRAIGVREERRIIGEHVLTEAEVRRGVIFPDAVAVNTYHLDFHWPDRMQRGVPDKADPAALPLCGCLDMLDPHHLPLRMMIPKGAKNLLVPGRGASADQMAMSSFRVMATVAQMGFAAGHAARQSLETGNDLTCIDVAKLQEAIVAGGQVLDLSVYGRYLRHDIFAEDLVFEGPAVCRAPSIAQVTNGRFLVAWAADGGVWLSERRERAWSAPQRIAEAGPDESPRLSKTPDGSVRLLVAGSGFQKAWISSDEGRTWQNDPGRPVDEETPAPIPRGALPFRSSVSGIVRMDEGLLAVAGSPEGSTRMAIALSSDEGATWPHQLVVGGGADGAPDLIPTRVGLALVYVAGGNLIAFWHGSQERIMDILPKRAVRKVDG